MGLNRLNVPLNKNRPEPKEPERNYIPSNIYIVRVDDRNQEVERLRIQTVPDQLNVEPEANWATVPSIGRNNPFYHYTGGEDILKFTIDWYSVEEMRDDVINKCRWVESLSRADGYTNEPPRVLLIFGDLFRYTTWIVKAAPYRLSLFDREKKMLPRQAYQDLELAKVVDQNTTISDRRYYN